ncbi:MAG: DeoR-like helix-turn-helix domain protein [candidate division WS6 bacterium OLB20]|uniref:DeoR-like helix-turn-helix domain protein n=1 Tax=candidate division WS6 bacterium OLB20 TaxID=1617426 RepID=A0A136LYN1_9BACT|nr:MAG: DeoR-like helix-turn-helix domain protein [candidate division WS6 bacterium OLB20]
MFKLLKNVFKLILLIAAAYGGFKLSRKIASGQLTMKFNADGPFGSLDTANLEGDGRRITLNSRQREIYKHINDKGEIEMNDLAKQIKGVTRRTLRRDLSKLVDEGLVIKQGKTKSAKYVLADD